MVRVRYLCEEARSPVEKRLEVKDRAFLSIFTGCDITDEGNLELLLDEMVKHSEDRIAALNALKEKITEYEKALENSQVPNNEDSSSS
jgi:hypothetical protein